jgi:tetrahydromethanopterin S-methyltransferase subunit B
MEMFEVREEIKKIDDNVGRNIESLDPHPPPTITDWYREKEEKKNRQIIFL